MTRVCRYWRPRSLDDAFLLLDRPYSMVIGGGTRFGELDGRAQPVEVVDLQDVLPGAIRVLPDGDAMVSAGTTLQEIADDPRLPDPVRAAARRERPSALRTQATVGSFVARPPGESLLLATLLACDARVEVADAEGHRERSLLALMTEEPLTRGQIVTSVRFSTAGRLCPAVTARTGADRPIVAAVARVAADRFRLVVAGLSAVPVVVDDPSDAGRSIYEAAAGPDALDDFRGSGPYRHDLAQTLARRATAEVTA